LTFFWFFLSVAAAVMCWFVLLVWLHSDPVQRIHTWHVRTKIGENSKRANNHYKKRNKHIYKYINIMKTIYITKKKIHPFFCFFFFLNFRLNSIEFCFLWLYWLLDPLLIVFVIFNCRIHLKCLQWKQDQQMNLKHR
jgi:hypothetical protein